jgi:hypothetical protein
VSATFDPDFKPSKLALMGGPHDVIEQLCKHMVGEGCDPGDLMTGMASAIVNLMASCVPPDKIEEGVKILQDCMTAHARDLAKRLADK